MDHLHFKIRIYILISLFVSFFSTCLAEDFWMKLGNGELNYRISRINITSDNELFISISSGIIYRSINRGLTWELLNMPFDYGYLRYIDSFGYIYIDYSNQIYTTHKDSSNWKFLYESSDGLYAGIILLTEYNNNFYLTNWGQIIKFNEDWTDTNIVFQEQKEAVNAIAVDSLGTMYAGTTDYMNKDRPGGIYRSFDNGDTWNDIKLENHFVTSIAVDSESRIFAGTSGNYFDNGGRIFRSTDSGDNWLQLTYGTYVNCLAINSVDDIFAGLCEYGGGIVFSDDHGDTWSYLSEGLGGEVYEGGAGGINDIAISTDGYVYLATDGGVYRSINSTTGIDENYNIVKNFKLYQNFPNPFNNETIISFSMESAGVVELNVFNIKGELINNLLNKKLTKGKHSIHFKADELNSGVYFYQLVVDKKIKEVRSMLYMK